jgi:hypothetical protein
MSMAVLQDIRGNPLTGADDNAATAYMEGLTRFNLFIGDPIASAEVATASAPGFVMGHVLRAWLLLLRAVSDRVDTLRTGFWGHCRG